MNVTITRTLRIAIVAALLCTVALLARANTILVRTTNDSGAASLRQALIEANDGDTIIFLVAGTIRLTSGELLVDKDIIISGPGAIALTIDGNGTSRVFHIASGRTVTISGLGVKNGNTTQSGGGIYIDHATLALENCAIGQNRASDGAGIANDGNAGTSALYINNSTITQNLCAGLGGGIYNYAIGGNAALQISNSAISDNSAGQGGAIFNNGSDSGGATVEISNSSLSTNLAIYAGAIFNYGEAGSVTVTLKNSTISSNAVQAYGGAIYNDDQGGSALLDLSDSTFSDNSAGAFGGGIFNIGGQGDNAVVSLGNTIFKAGATGENIVNAMGTITSLGYNLSSDNGGGYLTAAGDQINTDPLLGPLQDNGGPTFTHGLLPGSPAIDAGEPSFTPPPFYDQRGPNFFRIRNDRVDVGSFEVQAGSAPTPSPTPTPTAMPRVTPRPHPAPRPRPTPP